MPTPLTVFPLMKKPAPWQSSTFVVHVSMASSRLIVTSSDSNTSGANLVELQHLLSFSYWADASCKKKHTKTRKYPLLIGITSSVLCILCLCMGALCWRRCVRDETTGDRGTVSNNFDQANKIGGGGFGSVFKGKLADGTLIACLWIHGK